MGHFLGLYSIKPLKGGEMIRALSALRGNPSELAVRRGAIEPFKQIRILYQEPKQFGKDLFENYPSGPNMFTCRENFDQTSRN
jgi:hypothetical protein